MLGGTMQIETLLTPAEIALLPQDQRPGRWCVVLDILRATTSIVTGLAHGMERVVPVSTLEEARDYRQREPQVLLGGERGGNRPEGFDLGNSPQEYCHHAGRTVISTTTNGTVALRACEGAQRILAASLLNLGATAEAIRQGAPSVLQILCAGTFEEFALEDGVAAGLLARAFPEAGKNDATRAMEALVAGAGADETWPQLLRSARNARALVEASRGGDVEWALQVDLYPEAVVVCSSEGCRLAR